MKPANLKIWVLILFTQFFLGSTQAMNTPNLSSPANNSTFLSFGVTLICNQVTGAPTGYQFRIDSTANFTSSFDTIITSTFNGAGSPLLQLGKSYFWRARAFKPGDTSAWTASFKFTVQASGNSVLASPSNNSSGPIVYLNAQNYSIYENGGYIYEYDTSASLGSPMKKLSIMPFNQLKDSLFFRFGQTIYWRARAFTKLGDTLGWSPTWKYSTLNTPSIGGGTGISVVDPLVYVGWTNGGLATILLEYDTSSQYNSFRFKRRIVTPGKTSDSLPNLFFGKDYFYRIRFVYGLDSSNYSVSRQIRIKTPVNNFSPSNGGKFNSLVGLIGWNNMAGVSYRFIIYSDSAETQVIKDTITNKNSYNIFEPLRLKKWYRIKLQLFHAEDTSQWISSNFQVFGGEPNLGQPSNNAILNTVRPRLNFRKFPWAQKYIMDIDTGSNFIGTPSSYFIRIVDSFNYDGFYFHYIDTTLRFNQKYAWRVFLVVNGDTGDPVVRNFTTPKAPTLYFPNNNFIGIGTQTNGLVTGITGSTQIQWQIDTSVNFNSGLVESGADPHVPDDFEPQYILVNMPKALKFETKYFWRTRCIHSFDTSQWSTPFNFTTTQRMWLTAPANGATGVSINPTLEWGIQGRSLDYIYQYQLATDSNFIGIPVVTLPANTVSGLPVFCSYATTYYWRFRAINAVDTSRWSLTWNFRTGNPPPIGVPNLTSPANGAKNVPIGIINLYWNFAANALSYDVEVSELADFSTTAASGNTTNNGAIFSGAQSNKRYYWRVRGVNGPNKGNWSVARWFETAPPVGIEEINLIDDLRIFPIPANDILTLESTKVSGMKLFNLEGKMVAEAAVITGKGSIETSTLSDGVYLLEIELNGGELLKKKVLIKHD